MEVFSPNTSGENLLKELEKLAQKPLGNLIEKSTQTPKFIGLEKLAVGSQVACRSTARSTGQRSDFLMDGQKVFKTHDFFSYFK